MTSHKLALLNSADGPTPLGSFNDQQPNKQQPNDKQPNDKQLRRLVAKAVAQSRRSPLADAPSYTKASRLQAHVLPLDGQRYAGLASPIEVQDFDERGITFHHPQPLLGRRALVVLEGLNLGRIAAEVDLSWCRFSSGGRYTSGGRFVQLAGKTA